MKNAFGDFINAAGGVNGNITYDSDSINEKKDYMSMIKEFMQLTVLSNLGNGWGYEMTPAELAKKDEFYSIYWSEYNFVKENGSSELREMPDYLDQDRPSFEARA